MSPKFRKSRVPKYRRHANGQAFIQVKGQRHYLGKWGSAESQESYAQRLAELAKLPVGAALSADPKENPPALAVVQLIEQYYYYARLYYRRDGQPTGSLQNVKAALRTLKQLYGTRMVADFDGPCLLNVQQTLANSGVSRGYVNKQIGTIKRMFKWGLARDCVPFEVCAKVLAVEGLRMGRSNARETAPVRPVDDQVVEATLPHLPPIVADMVRFQRLTGARPGEVCQLRPGAIDRSGEVWQYRPEHHKTEHHGKERVVYIGPQSQEILKRYLLRPAGECCFQPAESEKKRREEMRAARKTPVQPSQQRRAKPRPKRAPSTLYTTRVYNHAITRTVEKINRQRTKAAAAAGEEPELLPHWHANQLRHTAATKVRAEFGLEAAQLLLGHSRADVTQIYAERDARLALEVSKRIG